MTSKTSFNLFLGFNLLNWSLAWWRSLSTFLLLLNKRQRHISNGLFQENYPNKEFFSKTEGVRRYTCLWKAENKWVKRITFRATIIYIYKYWPWNKGWSTHLYAGDLVLFPLTEEGSPKNINNRVRDIFNNWGLVINTDKSKIMTFSRNGSMAQNKSKFNIWFKTIRILGSDIFLQ